MCGLALLIQALGSFLCDWFSTGSLSMTADSAAKLSMSPGLALRLA